MVVVSGPALDGTREESSAQPQRMFLPLFLISALHLGLCVWVHAGRAWQDDELGSSLALRKTYHELLTHFGTWQSMNFYLSGLKAIDNAVGDANWLLVLPGIAAGVWLVWLTASLALRLESGRFGALVAALLVAVNPFLVGYSVTIRSYIFLTAFSTAMILELQAWSRTGRWREGVLTGVYGALALLAHTNALYTYVVAAVLALGWTFVGVRHGQGESLARLSRLALPVVILAALVGAAYLPQLADIASIRERWSDTPPIALTFLPALFSRFFGAGILLLPALLMLLYAAWRASRDRRASQWMILAVCVAVGSISMAGVSHFPWTYARFLIAILPWLILLIADGAAALALDSRRTAVALVLVLCATSLIALGSERQRMHAHPWQDIAAALREPIAAGDPCVLLGGIEAKTALSVYGVECPNDAAETLVGLPPEASARLTLVVIPDPLEIALPVQSLGSVRIFTLSGRPREIAATLSQALITGANDRVLGELAEVYKLIGGLLRWIGPPGSAGKYEQLLKLCRAQALRYRNLPPQLQRETGAGSDI